MINYKQHIASMISIDGVTADNLATMIVSTADDSKGDYSLPCFRFAKQLRQSPMAIADSIKSSFAVDSYISKVESVAGYVNFFVNKATFVADTIAEVNGNSHYGYSNEGEGKTI